MTRWDVAQARFPFHCEVVEHTKETLHCENSLELWVIWWQHQNAATHKSIWLVGRFFISQSFSSRAVFKWTYYRGLEMFFGRQLGGQRRKLCQPAACRRSEVARKPRPLSGKPRSELRIVRRWKFRGWFFIGRWLSVEANLFFRDFSTPYPNFSNAFVVGIVLRFLW